MDAGFVSITVDVDKPRELRLDFNVLCEAERVSGINFLMDWSLSMSANGLRALCWASWKIEEPELTLERVGDILSKHHATVLEALTQAALEAMPEPEEAEEGRDPTETTTVTQ